MRYRFGLGAQKGSGEKALSAMLIWRGRSMRSALFLVHAVDVLFEVFKVLAEYFFAGVKNM